MFNLEENRTQSTAHLQKGEDGHIKVSSHWLTWRVLTSVLGVLSGFDVQNRIGTERKGRIASAHM